MRNVLCLAIVALSGCAPAALPREFGETAKVVAASLTDQAVWERLTAHVDAEVIEPGIEVQAGVLYVARARLTGMSGRVGLSGDGVGSGDGPSDEARRAILDALAGDHAVRDAILDAIRRATSQPVNP